MSSMLSITVAIGHGAVSCCQNIACLASESEKLSEALATLPGRSGLGGYPDLATSPSRRKSSTRLSPHHSAAQNRRDVNYGRYRGGTEHLELCGEHPNVLSSLLHTQALHVYTTDWPFFASPGTQ